MSRLTKIVLIASFLMLEGCGVQLPKTDLNLTAYNGFRERRLNIPYQLEVEMGSATIWFSDSKLGTEASTLVEEVLGYVVSSRVVISDQALIQVKIKTTIDYVGSLTYVNDVVLTISDRQGNNLFNRTARGRYKMPGKHDDSMVSNKSIFFNSFANAMEPIASALLNSPELARIAGGPQEPIGASQSKPSMADAKSTIDPGTVKPSIFIAYPKDVEELAEDSINVVGYVTSTNRTEKFGVFVNRFPLNVSSLWTDAPLETKGLRGYPVELTVPLQMGENRIQLQVKDEEGFVERKTLIINRIEIIEDTQITSIVGLPPRFPNVEVVIRDQSVTSDNFMAVLGDWVKDTAKSDYNKGNTMFDQGRFARAAYYYRKSIKTEPLGHAWFNLGISEKALDHENKAGEAFSNACRLQISHACDVES